MQSKRAVKTEPSDGFTTTGVRLSAAEIFDHPRLFHCVRAQAANLMSIHASNPRIASVFATQQRWLMGQLALAHYFDSASSPTPGFHVSRFFDAVVAFGVASRNTADAFVKEMQKYGYVHEAAPGPDRRTRPLCPAPIVFELICAWLTTHLATLDGLDDGARREAFLAQPQRIAAIQPRIAEGLLRSATIRRPDPTFSLFTWLDEGGVVMDWLCAGLADVVEDDQRITTSVTSYADLGERIRLSRTHLIRKLRMAETMGSLGWAGMRGKSSMWVSVGFLREYHTQQSVKLAIIDSAFQDVMVS